MARPLPRHRAREYETIFIIHPEATTDAIEQIAGRLTEVIDQRNGKLLHTENWGRRRLAYAIRKQEKGIYIYMRYLGYSDLVQEIERVMRMLEPILKYLTVKRDEDVDPDARPVREEDISFLLHPEDDADAEETKDSSDAPTAGLSDTTAVDTPDGDAGKGPQAPSSPAAAGASGDETVKTADPVDTDAPETGAQAESDVTSEPSGADEAAPPADEAAPPADEAAPTEETASDGSEGSTDTDEK
ncbi:MAG: 30S ribosomal protein S6 [Myxococcota bacterium]|nr:30S ribosomal protein S6 [Myxococcota bacterium]